MRGKYVIAGIGQTPFGKLGLDTITLNTMACAKALEDAGVSKRLVDAVFVKGPTSLKELLYGQKVAEALGIQPRWGGAWDQGGAANITLINIAMMAIETGQCDVALVTFADNPRSGSRQAYSRPRGNDKAYGWFSTAAGYAMIQKAYMERYHVPAKAFGAVAVAARKHGSKNPNAQLRNAIDLEDYMNSPWMVEPLRRDDICLVSDGAAAVVVMSEKRARELNVPHPVPILGIGGGQTSFDVQLREDITRTQAELSARTAFEMAGLQPSDMDVAQLYDCFTITVLMTLEDYGFCRRGEAYDFVRGGQIEIGGRLPINTSGGLLSETGMPGMQLIVEGVRQMRGTANLQVPNARHCVVSNQGGVMHTHSTLILGGAVMEPMIEIDGINESYWSGLRRGELQFQACPCDNRWLPPRKVCPNCLGTRWHWQIASGRAILKSWVVYHHAYHEDFKSKIPYNVAIVRLEEGPQLIANIAASNKELRIDAPLHFQPDMTLSQPLARFSLV